MRTFRNQDAERRTRVLRMGLSILLLLLVLMPTGHTAENTRNEAWFDESLSFEVRVKHLVAEMTLEEKVTQLLNAAPAIERLELPEYNWWNEALHGVARNGKATVFPQVIGLAASFDEDLAFRMADAISTEARAKYLLAQASGNRNQYAGLTFWSPNVNIFRDPRWGRGQETFGESPLLNARMGVAFVKGIQGDHPKYLKAAAAAKHFAVHSGPEALRHTFNVVPSQKDLYETYLPAFEALVTKASVAGLMCAYNAVDGQPACASDFLLKEQLKEAWKFSGYIVSDCGALNDLVRGHKTAASEAEAAAAALNAGVNLNCGGIYKHLPEAVKQGFTKEEVLDRRLTELLMIRFRLGMFDPVKSNPYNNVAQELIHSPAHVSLAREVATKSIVLLKNDNDVLPLSKDVKVPYVTGPFAASNDVLMASYYGVSSDMVTVLEGIADKLSLSSSLNYRMGALPFHENINPLNWAPMVARTADVTIAVVGISADMEGEEVDAIASADKGDRVHLRLPQNQVNYIKQIAENKKGPLILVVASGSPVALGELYDLSDAIVQMWYPGEQGGNAVADVLFGDANPSGHLPLTFPKSIEQVPPYENYSMQGRTYKFMEKEPLFTFGFGLSYSRFEFSKLKIDQKKLTRGKGLAIGVDIDNLSDRAGENVVQLYLAPLHPGTEEARFVLKAFKRISLNKNSNKHLEFHIPASDLVRIDSNGHTVNLSGEYRIYIADALPGERSLSLGATRPVFEDVQF